MHKEEKDKNKPFKDYIDKHLRIHLKKDLSDQTKVFGDTTWAKLKDSAMKPNYRKEYWYSFTDPETKKKKNLLSTK